MHELSIATELLRQAAEIGSEHGAIRVSEIVLAVGVMEQVVPDALETALAAISDGTLLQGARLTVRVVPVRAECRGCGHVYAADISSFACPACRQADPEIIEGKGIVLESLECVTEEEAEDGKD